MDWPFADYEPLERVCPAPADGVAQCRPGELWRARRRSDDAPAMVKIFADRALADREAALARAVDHPHVLTADDIVTGGGLSALVLPHAQRGSLGALLSARHRLSWPETLTVLIPIADALAAAHERDLIHGDLSCGNIVIDAAGRPLLTDFGAARAAIEAGAPVAATPTDVAPEIVRGAAPSAATDLFSLGSVALRCLTGRPAWPAKEFDDVLVQSAAGQWPDIEENMAPAPLCNLVRRLLSADPAERGSAATVSVALRSIGRPEPIRHEPGREEVPATQVRPDAVRPPAELGRLLAARGERRPVRRRHPALIAAALIVVAAAAITGWRWPTAQPTRDLGAAAATMTESISLPTSTAAAPPTPSAALPTPSTVPAPETEEETNWFAVVDRLDRARARALAALDPAQLAAVYTVGSDGIAADTAAIADLLDRQLRPAPVRHRMISVDLIGVQPDGGVVVEVTAALPSVLLSDVTGKAVARTAGSARTISQLRLIETAAGYRIDGIWPGSA